MSLATVVLELAVVVATMLAVAALVVVGPRRLAAAVGDVRWRLKACLLPLAALAVILFLRWVTVDAVVRLERQVVGNPITSLLFEFERLLFPEYPVAFLQSFQTPELTSYFVFIYIYGYAFLLLFPFVAYFALEEMDELSTLIVAFAVNYGIGLVCYILFLAMGPRNVDPTLFEGLLYDAFPESRTLTNQVNQNTNVFPSLHTSLAMTVFFLAWHTRDEYPLWLPISGVLAISVALSTMYLGIHWFLDVAAGIALAALSVYIARNYTVEGALDGLRGYLAARIDREGRPGN
ncbi:phosphatase PAP2 family protein [Halobiforma nitratireducens]|uniref:PA-phosphatase-like phosphoesterase n=1 Tax=Halobiforma nitratireducens JCM 10879 TaxID=1227454 RepID=M0LT88_9EURY|nr:phosphatase PAP2 family protein [Halobiforma nitratireducens]EMA36646.1 PA-phosphatase-like phosphoesterase [Halobiforma nitratireducens JCM 10879]